jgi:hypothetical protein
MKIEKCNVKTPLPDITTCSSKVKWKSLTCCLTKEAAAASHLEMINEVDMDCMEIEAYCQEFKAQNSRDSHYILIWWVLTPSRVD